MKETMRNIGHTLGILWRLQMIFMTQNIYDMEFMTRKVIKNYDRLGLEVNMQKNKVYVRRGRTKISAFF